MSDHVPLMRPEEFEAVLEALPNPVFIHDMDTVLWANQAGCKMLDAPGPSALEGRPLRLFVHVDGHAAGAERREALLIHGAPIPSVRVKLVDVNDRTLYCDGGAWPVQCADRTLVVTVGTGYYEYADEVSGATPGG